MSKAHQGTYLRTQETWEAYKERRNAITLRGEGCFMCKEGKPILKRFEHWLIITNQYPYDAVASRHDMLIPIEHVPDKDELSLKAFDELEQILQDLNLLGTYDCIMQNFTVGQSQPEHLHYHLVTWKRHDK